MSLLSRIKSAILGEQPPKLRNKPGGLAWITNAEHGLYGRIVTTVRVDDRCHWFIDPPLPCTLTSGPYVTVQGNVAGAGDSVELIGIHDDYLQPIRNPGDDERSQELDYLPAVPKVIPLRVRGEVS